MLDYALILAGGPGTRLWPMSRRDKPKQVQQMLDGNSMLDITIKRLKEAWPQIEIYVSTGSREEQYVREATQNFSNVHVFVEPHVKSTGPAISLAVEKIRHIASGDAVLGVFPSDHQIDNKSEFFHTVEKAASFASKSNNIVLLGARPTYAATKYGYIETSNHLPNAEGVSAFYVKRFIEKPDRQVATKLIESASYLWNMGIFIAQLSTFNRAYQEHAPDIWNHVNEIGNALGASNELDVLNNEYFKLKTISIDYAVIEKYKELIVLSWEGDWIDIGDWSAIYKVSKKDVDGNVKVGNVHPIKTANSYIQGCDRPIFVLGLSDIIVVDTGDAILVVPKGDAHSVGEIRDYLQKNEFDHLI